MATFTVKQIIDGDTFQVSPSWEWNGQSGDRVRPAGYDAPEMHQYGGQAAKEKLARLIMGKMVELRNPHTVDRGRLVCDVFIGGRNLADSYPSYR